MDAQRHGSHGGEAASRRHAHDGAFDSDRLAAMLEVEAEVSSGLVEEAITLCAVLLDEAGATVRRIIDLGCGPGVGTTLLARAFPSAAVLSVDGSRAMLERVEARAARLGHAARIDTRLLDLNGDLADLGRCDLAWAAMAVHHADDEVATLRRFGSLLEPRGLLCVLERADPVVVRLADDLGRPGIWDRFVAARLGWFERARTTLPGAVNADVYPGMLAAAGLQVVVDRTVSTTVEAPHDAATHQFVADHLQRTARDLAGVAPEEDLTALRAFIDGMQSFPDGRWDGATITSSRIVLVARRAPGGAEGELPGLGLSPPRSS